MNYMALKKAVINTISIIGVSVMSGPLLAASLFLISACASAANEPAAYSSKMLPTENAVSSKAFLPANVNYLGRVNKLPNCGFDKNPSPEFIAKFPMCDDFLNVEWLDKENGYGYLEHDLYFNGKLLPPKKSLIYIHGKQVEHMIDLNRHFPDEFGKVMEAIKKGNKVPSSESLVPYVEYQGFRANFFRHDYLYGTYAENHQNVCIVYPDNQRAWLVEVRFPENIFDTQQIEEKAKKVAENFSTMTAEYLMGRGVIDINNDGFEDYIIHFSVFFSTPEGYKLITKLSHEMDGKGKYYYVFGVKHTDVACKIYDYSGEDLTTDGKDYFLNTDCNLTELSTQ